MDLNSSKGTVWRPPSRKYLWIYSAGDPWVVRWHSRLLLERKEAGFDVQEYCNTPVSLGGRWLPFPELDYLWRIRDRALLEMYDGLLKALEGRNIIVLYNGTNLHPEFVEQLKVLKVFAAADDPESTNVQSKPVAKYFDIHLINNIACTEMYRSWGLRDVHFWPLGSLNFPADVVDITEPAIRNLKLRTIKAAFFGEFNSHRRGRLRRLARAFPDSVLRGRGWPGGMVNWDEVWATYKKTQIGWNLHNSTGPINFRLYDLAALGVLQICDNKSNLGKIFELDREIIGFDSMKECIDKTRFYLEHHLEQREIALAGWKRWTIDYTPLAIWRRLDEIVANFIQKRGHELIVTQMTQLTANGLSRKRWKPLIRSIYYAKKANARIFAIAHGIRRRVLEAIRPR